MICSHCLSEMSSNQLAFLQWATYDQCITGTTHLSFRFLNRAFSIHACAKDNVATPWYAVKLLFYVQ